MGQEKIHSIKYKECSSLSMPPFVSVSPPKLCLQHVEHMAENTTPFVSTFTGLYDPRSNSVKSQDTVVDFGLSNQLSGGGGGGGGLKRKEG